jgi:hypothetical protein
MKSAKLIVMYPTPVDVDRFEQRYAQEHVPLAVEKLAGKTRFVASLIKASVSQDLDACLNSPGGQETAQYAVDISTGGAPLFLIAEVESFDF